MCSPAQAQQSVQYKAADVLQPPSTAKRDHHQQGVDLSASRGNPPEAPPALPHHASFPQTAAELVLDLTVEGHNAASSSTAYTGFGERPSMAGPDQVNILNLPLPDFDTISGQQSCLFFLWSVLHAWLGSGNQSCLIVVVSPFCCDQCYACFGSSLGHAVVDCLS